MYNADYIIIGGNGLVGKSMVDKLRANKYDVISVDIDNYKDCIGKKAKVLINANGNTYRFKANNKPHWDFNYSVQSVLDTFKDFNCELYLYVSTVDVYNDLSNPSNNTEKAIIDPTTLDYYGFHKWLSERLVQKYCSKSIILRLGTVLGENMKKGPLYDLLNNNPLHMSYDSKLTFIDINILSSVLLGLLKMKECNQIYNVTGKGYVELNYLKDKFSLKSPVDKSSQNKIYKYNINNQKLDSIFGISTSKEIAENFIQKKNHNIN